ncbi:hypothetical protein TRVA0_003S00650 [Trichomonascus vanleenenianus]|uniref:HVA22/TB2/DP1 family protein n=1 Tax=Trichomonascus vanleenenianus TaxID=2268995 RepID=UPI003ECA00CC
MFDFVFRCLSSLASFAFPVFASYKALQKDDITLIKPWLMYWVIIAIQLTFEAYFGFILAYLPLYNVVRMAFMLWLVLPQSQGASQIYVAHVHPFLEKHEHEIDSFIAQTHENARALGVEYLQRASHFVRQYVSSLLFGAEYRDYESAKRDEDLRHQREEQLEPAATASGVQSSYADLLFSRFRYPAAVSSSAASNLGSLLGGASSSIRASLAKVSFPTEVQTKTDKLDYLNKQRSKLMELLTSLDERRDELARQEEEEISTPRALNSSASKSSLDSTASESDFDVVKKEEADNHARAEEDGQQTPTTSATGEPQSPQSSKGWFW